MSTNPEVEPRRGGGPEAIPATGPIRPDFGGAVITGIVPAVLAGEAAPFLPSEVSGARTVVLLVLDGVGWHALQQHRELLPVLSSLGGGYVTTVAPSTTSSALTSLTTGLAPGEHGVVGFRVRVDEVVVNVLSWSTGDHRRAPDPFTMQRHTAFLGREVPVVTKSQFARTAFTELHLRGGRFVGWSAPSALVEHCRRLAAAEERFVYAYYPGPDTVAHEHGLLDGFYAAELAAADRMVGEVLDAVGPDVVVLVTSDHGQVHVGPEGWLGLGSVASMVDRCSGDGRFRYLHARRGAAAELLAAAGEVHGGHAWVFSRERLLDEGWLGPVVSGVARRRVGDVVLAASEPVAFVDPALPGEARLVSAHGSLTPDEMLVPLLAGRGRG